MLLKRLSVYGYLCEWCSGLRLFTSTADQGKTPAPSRTLSTPVSNSVSGSTSNGAKSSTGSGDGEVKTPKQIPAPLPLKSISTPAKPPTPPPVQFTSGQSSSQSTSSDDVLLSPMATISRSISGVVRAGSLGIDVRDRCREMLYKAMKKHVESDLLFFVCLIVVELPFCTLCLDYIRTLS